MHSQLLTGRDEEGDFREKRKRDTVALFSFPL